MDKQEKEAKELVKRLPFTEKLQHFWDYNKWKVFALVIALILVFTTIIQVVTRVEYDMEIAYYGSANFGDEQAQKLEEYLKEYTNDLNEDGEVNVKVRVVQAEAPGMNTGQLTEYQAGVGQKFSAELAARVYDAYIFDDAYYKYAGPESDYGIMESAFDMTQNQELCQLLGIGEEPIYWCTCIKRTGNGGSAETAQKRYDNTILAQNAITAE